MMSEALLGFVMILSGMASGVLVSWASGWNEMSNRVVATRIAARLVSLELGIMLIGLAFRADDAAFVASGAMLLVAPVLILVTELVSVRRRRRTIALAARSGAPLPRGVDRAKANLWADQHLRDDNAT